VQIKKQILFILNPKAGIASKADIPRIIDKSLDKGLFEYFIVYTACRGHAHELAKQAASNEIDVVVAIGGDGTMNEAASALIHTQTILGLIPCGSGNGLARQMQIPLKVEKAIQLIIQGHHTEIDYGTINNKPFFCTAGIGFDAHIGKLFGKAEKRGFSSYIITTLKEFGDYQPETYFLEADKEIFNLQAFLITFANAGQYGNNAYISPQADISDGKLDLCILGKFPKTSALQLAYRLFSKTMHRSRYMTIKKVHSVKIHSNKQMIYHLDGENYAHSGNLQVSIIPAGLKIITP
jgi:diacylglycerol kinase (ATP)